MTKATLPRPVALPERYISPLLTSSQAAAYLACSTTLLELFVEREALSFVKLGDGQRRFRIDDLDAFAAARVVRHVNGRVTIDLGKK